MRAGVGLRVGGVKGQLYRGYREKQAWRTGRRALPEGIGQQYNALSKKRSASERDTEMKRRQRTGKGQESNEGVECQLGRCALKGPESRLEMKSMKLAAQLDQDPRART